MMTPAEAYKAVVGEIRAGKNINAVRLVMDNFGLKVKEAKDLVEAIIETKYATPSDPNGL